MIQYIYQKYKHLFMSQTEAKKNEDERNMIGPKFG